MKLRILISIKYKSTQRRIWPHESNIMVQKYIVHLFQDNEITESSPKAVKDAKTWELPGAPPLDPTKGHKVGPWTPPVSARATRSVGTT